MDKAQKAVVASLIITSSIAWIASIQQPDMMLAMTSYNPLAISLFTASWTAGMAAMMLPAITPMVLLYNKFITNKGNGGRGQSSVTIHEEGSRSTTSTPKTFSIRSFRVVLFICSYLLVWALTGIALLLGWSVVMNNAVMTPANSQILPGIYGAVLIIAGAYQFTPLKKTCIGYCESPLSFFMRRWKDGTSGAVRMGLWHGLYCLGCCWAYFLLMMALGWMNLLWMGLFAGVIFGEKMWKRGIWVARAAGAGLLIVGILVMAGMLPTLVSSASPLSMASDDGNNAVMDMNGEAARNNNGMPTGDGAGNSMDMASANDNYNGASQSTQPPMDSSNNRETSNTMEMK